MAPYGARVREPLRGHDDTRQGSCLFIAAISMTFHLSTHPPTQGPVKKAPNLAVERAVLLEAFAQPHFLGQGNHHVAIVNSRQLLREPVAHVFGPAVDAAWANSGFARKRNSYFDFALLAVQYGYAIVWVSTSNQLIKSVLGSCGQEPVAVPEASVVLGQECVQVVAKDSPEGALVALPLAI